VISSYNVLVSQNLFLECRMAKLLEDAVLPFGSEEREKLLMPKRKCGDVLLLLFANLKKFLLRTCKQPSHL
jgi:hypothetical protein